MKSVKPSKSGRPPLTDLEKGILLGALGGLTPKTKEFREKRAELAVQLKRTERSIELNLIALQAGDSDKSTGHGTTGHKAAKGV